MTMAAPPLPARTPPTNTFSTAASAAPQRLPPRRMRPALFGLALVMIVLGALGAYALVLSIGATQPFLALARSVPVGSRLTDADLQVVQINPAPGLRLVPARQRALAVGRYAKVDLVAGSLLSPDQLTTSLAVQPGQHLVGLQVKASQQPARALRPGDHVLLVVLPDSRGDSQTTTRSPVTIQATIVDVGRPNADGTSVVDVAVAASDGPEVAALAAVSRISIILTPKS